MSVFRITLAVIVVTSVVVAQQPASSALLRQGSGGQALRDRVQSYLDEWRAASAFPGASVGVVLKDGTAFGVATGVSDRGAATPMKVDDLLMAGSTGKTFFAAVALQLIEAGHSSISTRRSRSISAAKPWFSRLPNAKDITVRMLMTHTSGLVRYEMNPKFTADLRAQAGQGVDAGRGAVVPPRRDAAVRRRRRAGTTPTPTTSCSA